MLACSPRSNRWELSGSLEPLCASGVPGHSADKRDSLPFPCPALTLLPAWWGFGNADRPAASGIKCSRYLRTDGDNTGWHRDCRAVLVCLIASSATSAPYASNTKLLPAAQLFVSAELALSGSVPPHDM